MIITTGSDLGSADVPKGASLLHKPYASAQLRALAAGLPVLLDS